MNKKSASTELVFVSASVPHVVRYRLFGRIPWIAVFVVPASYPWNSRQSRRLGLTKVGGDGIISPPSYMAKHVICHIDQEKENKWFGVKKLVQYCCRVCSRHKA